MSLPPLVDSTSDLIVDLARPGPEAGSVTREVSVDLVAEQPRPRLGDVLVGRGVLDRATLERALDEQRRTGERLGELLLRWGVATEDDLAKALAHRFGLEYVDLHHVLPDRAVTSVFPEGFARRRGALPIRDEGGTLVVAVADPSDLLTGDDLRAATRTKLRLVVATPSALSAAIDHTFSNGREPTVVTTSARRTVSDAQDKLYNDVVVAYVDQIIGMAVNRGASDVHIEPSSAGVNVRFRVDGRLALIDSAPSAVLRQLVNRIKILGHMDIANTRSPQDGRFTRRSAGRSVEVRVITLPTVDGEAITLRLLDKDVRPLVLSDLGLSTDVLGRLRFGLSRPWGGVLVCGPTGAGKSTTLYAGVSELLDGTKNIVSVEDPVEYRVEGIKQIQVDERSGSTFASVLRSIVRADPDVVMIGEIRDRDSAKIAVEGALTGHLVLSTLHANDAPSAVIRLLDMGVDPLLISSAMQCVVAQRLVRRLCHYCAREDGPAMERLEQLGVSVESGVDERAVCYIADGCDQCNGTGYRGRTGIHEAMVFSEAVRRMVLGDASVDVLRALAVTEGMVTMRADGIAKALQGTTTLEEVLAATDDAGRLPSTVVLP